MSLGQEYFHTVLERDMGNPEIPVLYNAMVPCGLCTGYVVKHLWSLFVRSSMILILQKLFHGDTTENLYGKDTLNNLVAVIVRYPN